MGNTLCSATNSSLLVTSATGHRPLNCPAPVAIPPFSQLRYRTWNSSHSSSKSHYRQSFPPSLCNLHDGDNPIKFAFVLSVLVSRRFSVFLQGGDHGSFGRSLVSLSYPVAHQVGFKF